MSLARATARIPVSLSQSLSLSLSLTVPAHVTVSSCTAAVRCGVRSMASIYPALPGASLLRFCSVFLLPSPKESLCAPHAHPVLGCCQPTTTVPAARTPNHTSVMARRCSCSSTHAPHGERNCVHAGTASGSYCSGLCGHGIHPQVRRRVEGQSDPPSSKAPQALKRTIDCQNALLAPGVAWE